MKYLGKIGILILCLVYIQISAQVSKEEFLQNNDIPKVNIVFPTTTFSKVEFAEISQDKKLLATASDQSSEIILWDIGTGNRLKKINTSNNINWTLLNFKFSPDNKKIIIGYQLYREYGIIVYDFETELYFILTKATNDFIIDPESNIIIIPIHNKFQVYSLVNYELIKEIKNNTGSNEDIILSPRRNYLVALSDHSSKHKFAIFDFNSGNLISEIEQRKYKKTISGKAFILGYKPIVKFISDNKILINFDNGDFAVYDILKKIELTHISNPHNSYKTLTALSKDGKFLITTTKEDKILRLWDMNSHKDTSIPVHEMGINNIPNDICYSCIEADISNICFANDSILNIIFEDRYYGNGVIGININTWSICGMDKLKKYNEQIDLEMKLHPEQADIFFEMGTVKNEFVGDVSKISEVDNIIITTDPSADPSGDIRLYSGNYDVNTQQNENRAIQHFKSYVNRTNNTICIKNELYNCSDKEIRSYNLKTGANSIFKSIDPSEEIEETDSILIDHGESRFIGIEYLKDINCIAIAKHQDFKSKIIFQSLNAQDSSYTFIPEVPEIEDRNIEILGLKSSPNGNFIAVFWGFREDKQYVFTQIFNAKTTKLVTSFSEGNYVFSKDERFIAYYVRDSGIIIFSVLDSKIKYISKLEYLWGIEFSNNNDYLIYSTYKNKRTFAYPIIRTTSIVDFTKNRFDVQKQIQKNKLAGFYLPNKTGVRGKLYKWDERGNANLAIDFTAKYGWYQSFIPKNADSLIFIVNNYTIHVWSLNSLTELYTLVGHTNYITNILINEDKTQIVSYSTDQAIKFWDYTNGQLLYTKFDLQIGSIFYDKHYRFSTDKNIDLNDIYFVCGTEIIDLNQVKESLYQPNIVIRILNGENLDHLTKLDDMKICGVSPLVEPIDYNDGKFYYKIIPREGDIGDIEIYINDKLREIINVSSLKLSNGNYEIKINEELINENKIEGEELSISVIAKTKKNGINSRVATTVLEEKSEKIPLRKPEIYAIMIGIDDYSGEKLDLNYASKDAIDLHKAMELSAKKIFNFDSINRVHFFSLINKKDGTIIGRTPDRHNILETFDKVEKESNPEDIFLIFFAGHGSLIENKLNLLTAEASLEQAPNFSGITTQEILEKLSKIKASKRILFLDACHSGAAINDLGINSLVGKRDTEDLNAKSQRQKELDRIANKSGLAIITASSSTQEAMELPQYEHGLLTYSLLKTMLEEPNSLDKDNQLQLEDWLRETEKMVLTLSSDQFTQKFVPINYSVGKIDDEVRNLVIVKEVPMLYLESVFNINLYSDNISLGIELQNQMKGISSRGIEQKVIVSEKPSTYGDLIRVLYTINKNEEILCSIIFLKNEVIYKKIEVRGETSKEGIKKLAERIILQVLQNYKQF